MKYLKMLGLLAVAASALMAFAASASATTVTSPTGQAFTGNITAVAHNGHATLVGPLGIKVECASHVEGELLTNTPNTQTAFGNIKGLSFTACTNGYTVTVLTKGNLEAHTHPGDPAGTSSNGTLTSTGAEVTVHTPLGFNCVYKTTATDVGTITGSHTTGSHATIDVDATIPRTGHSGLCGASGAWKASYTVTVPNRLYID